MAGLASTTAGCDLRTNFLPPPQALVAADLELPRCLLPLKVCSQRSPGSCVGRDRQRRLSFPSFISSLHCKTLLRLTTCVPVHRGQCLRLQALAMPSLCAASRPDFRDPVYQAAGTAVIMLDDLLHLHSHMASLSHIDLQVHCLFRPAIMQAWGLSILGISSCSASYF